MFLSYRPTQFILLTMLLVVVFGSCTVIKNYPENRPFVFKNEVHVGGLASKDEKKRLETDLVNYWDDSLRVPTITQFGIRTVIKNPNPFDSANISSTIEYMNSYLNSQGYYNGSFKDSTYFDTVGPQIRTTVHMDIEVGRKLHIDSIAYDFKDTGLQRAILESMKQSFLVKDKPYSKQLVASELDRLVTLLRTNGYYKLTRDNLQAELDTTDASLLEITLDPFEQARRIQEAATRRRLNPTLDIVIRQRDSTDSVSTVKYQVGNIYYYPQAPIDVPADVIINQPYRYVETQREMTSRQNEMFIKFRPLRLHTYLRRGTVFDERNYFKTINALTQMGPWSQVDARVIDTLDTVPRLNFHFLLTPAPKYSFSTDLEGSRNTGTIIAGNLLGLANNINLRNRNIWRSGIQAGTTIRNGIELGFCDTCDLLQTFQSSISQTFSIPRFILPWTQRGVKSLDYYRTLINLNAAYTERRNYFRLRSIVGSWGYEWKKNNNTWLVRIPNIELYKLDTLPGLISAFETNPFLRTAFNTGYVVSSMITYSKTYGGKTYSNVSNYIRFAAESAGLLLGRIPGLRDKIYQYIKVEGEFTKIIKFRKTDFASRFYGGLGYNYSSDPKIGQTLPFFKQFVAGGPNSMRAWNLRQLGLGSSLASDTIAFRDRFGDIQLETNLEYRFPLTTVGGVKLGSALFADIGNIWNLKSNVSNPDSKLEWRRFLRDIAIGVGTGLRMDFNYFLIRVDFAYKLKDPARRRNNGWASLRDFEWRNKEYQIKFGDRFLRRNNYAFQIGIGLPF